LIQILACRLPLESDYRELWQLPYAQNVRTELLQRLIQARAILGWFGQLRRAGVRPEAVSLEPRDETQAPLASVGGRTGADVLGRAKAMEAAIYRLVGALLPPAAGQIEHEILDPYRPFDVMDHVRLAPPAAQQASSCQLLRPLAILDDAHFLHPAQLVNLKTWLVRRELLVGRWILSRLDVLQPKELFDSISADVPDLSIPGITAGRDIILINLQSTRRNESRRNFRAMAREMSRKYLSRMSIFAQNSITTLEEILPEKVDQISPSSCDRLHQSVTTAARRLHVSDERLAEFERMAGEFLAQRNEDRKDLLWAMVRILVHRYAKRTPQTSLFPNEEGPEPSKPLKADLGVYDGAQMHLLHDYDRPYYRGFDALSDAASENAETFLHLASHIVEAAENLLIKQKPSAIQAREQHKLLIERANMIVDAWAFPEHRLVHALSTWIAEKCVTRTLEPNAPLGHGANAYGLVQEDFHRIGNDYALLANVLKCAVAYNAITLVPNTPCKDKRWCLLELGGVFIVRSKLPFKRGGFVEGTAEELERHLKELS